MGSSEMDKSVKEKEPKTPPPPSTKVVPILILCSSPEKVLPFKFLLPASFTRAIWAGTSSDH